MKILMISNHLGVQSGVQRYVQNLLLNLDLTRYQVDLFVGLCPPDQASCAPALEAAGVHIIAVPDNKKDRIRALAAHLVHDVLQVLKAVPGALLKRNGGQIQADRVVIGVQAVHLPKLDVLRLTVRLDGGWEQHRRQLVAVNIAQAQFQVTCQ